MTVKRFLTYYGLMVGSLGLILGAVACTPQPTSPQQGEPPTTAATTKIGAAGVCTLYRVQDKHASILVAEVHGSASCAIAIERPGLSPDTIVIEDQVMKVIRKATPSGERKQAQAQEDPAL